MSDTKQAWIVTYHNGDVDEINAHAYVDLGGRAEFRDASGDLVAVVAANTYRSIIALDALGIADDFEAEQDEPCTVSEAKVTLFHADGTTDEFHLDSVEGCHYVVGMGTRETEPVDGWAQFESTGITSISLDLHGKGTARRTAAGAPEEDGQ